MDNIKFAKTADELGKFIKDDIDVIEIEGDLRRKVLKIKATGKIAWAVVVGAITVAIASVTIVPIAGMASFVAAPMAVTILGGSCTNVAISIAIAGGGIITLNQLRKYKIISDLNGRLVIKK